MQRTPQPPRAAATATATRPIAAASIHAKTGAGGAVQIAPSQAKGTTTAVTQSRRALQPLDSNQRAAPASIAKAPFAYVSRFSRPAASGPTPSIAKPVAPAVTGLKRKQQPGEDAKPAPAQSTEEADETEEVFMAASDPLEQQRRENVAWLDMLVALLERKYQRHAAPVDIEAIQDAKLLDAYWPQKTPPMATTSSKRSRVAVRVDTPPSATSSLSSTTSAGGGGAAVLSSQDDKEEKRTQALRRHAQQIHDTSVSSTSCCGCKTGCLKMYCVCFSTRGYCHDGCSCENCKNARASADLRLEVMTTYLLNDPRAFSHAATTASAASGFFQLLPQKASTVVLRGCRCKKSKCLKKYCECFQNGLGCGPHCRCVDCANDASPAAREMRARNASDMGTTATTTAASDGNHGAVAAATSAVPASGGAFHAIKVAVTKKPRRNYVLKSVRLRL